jgi:molybdenum cofactor synthesis domain-containing protein
VATVRDILIIPWIQIARIVPDGLGSVHNAIVDLVGIEKCDLVLTTGGTGPAPRDLTPEATEAACDKIMPGFGELMRRKRLEQVPTAILSRQTTGVPGKALVINLPGNPSSIRVTLLPVFPAIPTAWTSSELHDWKLTQISRRPSIRFERPHNACLAAASNVPDHLSGFIRGTDCASLYPEDIGSGWRIQVFPSLEWLIAKPSPVRS